MALNGSSDIFYGYKVHKNLEHKKLVPAHVRSGFLENGKLIARYVTGWKMVSFSRKSVLGMTLNVMGLFMM